MSRSTVSRNMRRASLRECTVKGPGLSDGDRDTLEVCRSMLDVAGTFNQSDLSNWMNSFVDGSYGSHKVPDNLVTAASCDEWLEARYSRLVLDSEEARELISLFSAVDGEIDVGDRERVRGLVEVASKKVRSALEIALNVTRFPGDVSDIIFGHVSDKEPQFHSALPTDTHCSVTTYPLTHIDDVT
jgi:hypothetical protein